MLLVGAACVLFGSSVFGDSAGISNASSLDARSGEQVYAHICQACHMSQGQGAVGAGRYPAFAHDPVLASAPYMALTVLAGRRGMPAFAPAPGQGESDSFVPPTYLTDAQVASVINYIRTHFGNHYTDAITTAEVRALRPQR